MIFVMIMDLERRRIIERQKAECREKIDFHAKNVILQTMVSFICLVGGAYAGYKKSIWVPLVIAPATAESVSRLSEHESKRRRYTKILKKLERE